MMGDYEDIGDDLVDTDSFVNHRGAGEEPFYVPEENDSDSSAEDNDVALDWSQEDLSAIMDELELMDDYSDDEQKDYDLIHWNLPEVRLVSSEESEEEGTEDSDLGEMRGNNSNGPEWYEYPYGQDFVEDFHCLQNSSYDVRNDLLDMLEITERSCSRSHSDTEVNSYSLHHEVQEAINDILIPGMSREGLRRLHKIVLREPSLNLKKYLENADPYVLAYIIWGLNFYFSRHEKGKMKKNMSRIIECGTQEPSVNENRGEEKMTAHSQGSLASDIVRISIFFNTLLSLDQMGFSKSLIDIPLND
ncbi:uncharacterized protein [Halyomorpha halys]|uniref:uncharacterized protein isoform X3 n=1 Tax=Halyomorpha halys TaxID=286706 RepID=UPI0034D33F1B